MADFPWGMGGSAAGHDTAFQACGGAKVVTEFLHKVGASGEALLVDAGEEHAQTVVLIQHYETEGRASRTFRARRKHQARARLSARTTRGRQRAQCELIMGRRGRCCRDGAAWSTAAFARRPRGSRSKTEYECVW